MIPTKERTECSKTESDYEILWSNLIKTVSNELETKIDKQCNSFDDKVLDYEVEFLKSMLNTINEIEGCVKEWMSSFL